MAEKARKASGIEKFDGTNLDFGGCKSRMHLPLPWEKPETMMADE